MLRRDREACTIEEGEKENRSQFSDVNVNKTPSFPFDKTEGSLTRFAVLVTPATHKQGKTKSFILIMLINTRLLMSYTVEGSVLLCLQ